MMLCFLVSFMDGLLAQEQKILDMPKSQGNVHPGSSIFFKTVVDMTWPDLKKAAEENALVILPVGVIEQHGPHLCLGTDTYLGYERSLELKQSLEAKGVKAVIAPPFYWGIMQLNESGAFPGSFTVSPATMKALLSDIFTDLHRWGFRNVFCFNHHGDRLHRETLNEAIAEAKEKLGLTFYNDQERQDSEKGPDFSHYVTGKLFEPNYHSGTPETAFMMEYYPEFVNVEIIKTLQPEATWQPMGYVGDPANYKAFNAKEYNEAEIVHIASCIARWLEQKAKM
jgi:creatinine amidohydrolase